MSTLSLDQVLLEAETLPPEDRAMLEELLRGRRIESWRHETAVGARSAVRAFKTGKLKGQSAEDVIATLRSIQ